MAIDTLQSPCPDETSMECSEFNAANAPTRLRGYIRHYEAEHGRDQYLRDENALKCYTCEVGFTSAELFVRHLISDIRYKKTRGLNLPLLDFSHYVNLRKRGLVWSVPKRYISIDVRSEETHGPLFPTNKLLKSAYGDGDEGYHLIFFFRNSSAKGVASKLQGHMQYVKETIKFLQRTGRINGHVSVVIISADYTKAQLMPSFFCDVDVEINFVSADLPEIEIHIQPAARLEQTLQKSHGRNSPDHNTHSVRRNALHVTCPCVLWDRQHLRQLATVQYVYGKADQAVWQQMLS